MLLNSDFIFAALKLLFIFATMLILMRYKWKLWQAIIAGCVLVGLVALHAGASLSQVAFCPLKSLSDSGLLLMETMIFSIMLLSGIQAATGQSQRLVEALGYYIKWPRLRLMLFPALVGFLPMPGGAIFSCPMLDAASAGLNISPKRKTLINYWFRHIWETTWPLYPGFILVCSLIKVPLYALMSYTFPLVFISLIIGWFFFLRDIKLPQTNSASSLIKEQPLSSVFYEALPLVITIAGAALFGVILGWLRPAWPSQIAFVISLSLANLVALWQGKGRFKQPIASLVLNKRTLSMMLLVYVIFVFKDMIGISGIVRDMSHAGNSMVAMAVIFLLLPMACGMLMGVMVGYVGASFPIILGLISEAGLEAYLLPPIVLGIVGGQVGQLSTPLHVCIVITCEYYKVNFSSVWKSMLLPLAILLMGGIAWVGALFMLGAHF